MRPGRVVTLRVNPKDCLSILDILDKAELYIPRMGFSAAVSLALSSMLEAYRQGGHIPVRDGFEYGDMMSRFSDHPKVDRVRKLAITEVIHKLGSEAQVPPAIDVNRVAHDRMDRRWNELQMRKQMTPENMSVEEERELEQLHKELGYPAVKADGSG